LPYAFTEQGVAMLSGVLNSERAIKVNIQIMRVFTKVREILMDNMSIRLEIEEIKKKLGNQDKNIELVFSYLDELIERHDTTKPGLTRIAGGSSYAVIIPIEYIRRLKWRGRQKLEVKLYQDRIIIRDWNPQKSLLLLQLSSILFN